MPPKRQKTASDTASKATEDDDAPVSSASSASATARPTMMAPISLTEPSEKAAGEATKLKDGSYARLAIRFPEVPSSTSKKPKYEEIAPPDTSQVLMIDAQSDSQAFGFTTKWYKLTVETISAPESASVPRPPASSTPTTAETSEGQANSEGQGQVKEQEPSFQDTGFQKSEAAMLSIYEVFDSSVEDPPEDSDGNPLESEIIQHFESKKPYNKTNIHYFKVPAFTLPGKYELRFEVKKSKRFPEGLEPLSFKIRVQDPDYDEKKKKELSEQAAPSRQKQKQFKPLSDEQKKALSRLDEEERTMEVYKDMAKKFNRDISVILEAVEDPEERKQRLLLEQHAQTAKYHLVDPTADKKRGPGAAKRKGVDPAKLTSRKKYAATTKAHERRKSQWNAYTKQQQNLSTGRHKIEVEEETEPEKGKGKGKSPKASKRKREESTEKEPQAKKKEVVVNAVGNKVPVQKPPPKPKASRARRHQNEPIAAGESAELWSQSKSAKQFVDSLTSSSLYKQAQTSNDTDTILKSNSSILDDEASDSDKAAKKRTVKLARRMKGVRPEEAVEEATQEQSATPVKRGRGRPPRAASKMESLNEDDMSNAHEASKIKDDDTSKSKPDKASNAKEDSISTVDDKKAEDITSEKNGNLRRTSRARRKRTLDDDQDGTTVKESASKTANDSVVSPNKDSSKVPKVAPVKEKVPTVKKDKKSATPKSDTAAKKELNSKTEKEELNEASKDVRRSKRSIRSPNPDRIDSASLATQQTSSKTDTAASASVSKKIAPKDNHSPVTKQPPISKSGGKDTAALRKTPSTSSASKAAEAPHTEVGHTKQPEVTPIEMKQVVPVSPPPADATTAQVTSRSSAYATEAFSIRPPVNPTSLAEAVENLYRITPAGSSSALQLFPGVFPWDDLDEHTSTATSLGPASVTSSTLPNPGQREGTRLAAMVGKSIDAQAAADASL